MNAGFEALGAGAKSPVGRLDPRVKIIAVLALIVTVISGPGSGWRPFVFYFPMLAAAVAAARIPASSVLRRIAWASPFILAAAALFPFSQTGGDVFAPGPWRQALVIALKAYASVLALSLLVLTDHLDRLLGAMRSLGIPAALASVAALAGRFLHLLGEEAARMKRARENRTPGRLRVSRIEVVGRAGAALFLRGWKRARTVQAAMEARGFDGSFPVLDPPRFRMRDALAAAAFLAPFLAFRVFLP